MVEGIVLCIPVYNPDEKFIFFLDRLTADGWQDIIVVDDGSKQECQHYFDEAVNKYGCQLVKHNINLGQGRAFKSAFNYFIGKYGGVNIAGVVECDCDGQHVVEDVNKCAELLRDNPDKFILGVRNFSDKSIPFRSRFGNKCTSLVFKMFCGMDISDTQTGLKGIPTDLVYKLIEAPGERFEYASSVLLEIKKQGVKILQYPIQTIYINGNETSHFNPLLDSFRIYSLIFKYIISSLITVLIDFVMFAIFVNIYSSIDNHIYLASCSAKIFSGAFNFLVNKKHVFRSSGKYTKEVVKYIVLCIGHILISATLINGMMKYSLMKEVWAKAIADTVLFFAVYYIQNMWVFKSEK